MKTILPRFDHEKASVLTASFKCYKNTRNGPSDRIRTCGLMVPNHPRYQLRYTRIKDRRKSRRPLYYILLSRSCQAKRRAQFSRFFPQKNSATVPGPVWAPMVVPMELTSTLPLSFWNRSSTSRATSLASSGQAELEM